MLLWNHYVVPQWTYGKVRTARWDRFGRPDPLPKYGLSGLSHHLVVGRRARRQDRVALVSGPPSRRRACLAPSRLGVVGGSALAARHGACLPRPPPAPSDARRHGISAFGDLKYPAGLSRISTTSIRMRRRAALFSQIGPNRQFNQNFLTFNSLNSYILKGDAAQGMELTFATLMARARDEPDAMYGLAARAVRISRRRADLPLPAAAARRASTTAPRSPRTTSPSRSRC